MKNGKRYKRHSQHGVYQTNKMTESMYKSFSAGVGFSEFDWRMYRQQEAQRLLRALEMSEKH